MIKSIVLDICKHPNPTIPSFILRQGDVGSITLNIAIVEDGDVFDLTEYEARFMCALTSGHVVIDPCEKIGGNALSYTLPAAVTAQPGIISLAYIAVYRDSEWIASTDCMQFKVLEGVDISAEEAENLLGEYVALKEKLDALLADATDRTAQQQTAWEEQMGSQRATFDAAEQERAEVIQSLKDLVLITKEEIDVLWPDR